MSLEEIDTTKALPLFRSVLPHEPPYEEDDDRIRRGYVLIQGSLLPKPPIIDGTCMDIPWIQKKLFGFFTSSRMPSCCIEIHIDDTTQPQAVTRARICYSNEKQAYEMFLYLRHFQISPNDIFSTSNSNYSKKPLQVSHVTTRTLPENSWKFSSPPKFRRLLITSDDGDDKDILRDHVAQVKTTTRYIYISSGIESALSNFRSWLHELCSKTTPDVMNAVSNDVVTHGIMLDAIRRWIQSQIVKSNGSTTTSDDMFVEVWIPNKKSASSSSISSSTPVKYCYVGVSSHSIASSLVQQLLGKKVCLTFTIPSWLLYPNAQQPSFEVFRTDTGALFLDWADANRRIYDKKSKNTPSINCSTRPECTSTTSHIQVPGLFLLPDFLSSEEEHVLLATLTGPFAPWAPTQKTPSWGSLKRRVQHYGYVFDYESAHVDLNTSCPPLPAVPFDLDHSSFASSSVANLRGWDVFAGILDRVRRIELCQLESSDEQILQEELVEYSSLTGEISKNTAATSRNSLLLHHDNHYYREVSDGSSNCTRITTPKIESINTMLFRDLNQVTINEYIPGIGIGYHIDTESAFGDGIISLTLKGGCTMEFRERGKKRKKLVYLPPKSLLVMCNNARYQWDHHIASRTTDTVDGKVIPRANRISLTLRTALTTCAKGDTNSAIPLPRLERLYYNTDENFNPRNCYTQMISKRSNDQQNDTACNNDNPLVTPETERAHVHNVYDAIATQWNHTRGKRNVIWPGATHFIQSLIPPGSIIADVGCGDGKYFETCRNSGHVVIGTDISIPLLQTTASSNIDVVGADCIQMPFVSSCFDAIICIAVMHHLSTVDRRKQCLRELRRLLVDNGGIAMIQAWALEQDKDSKHSFGATDVLVPFNAQPRYLKLAEEVENCDRINETVTGSTVVDVAEAYANMYSGAQFDSEKGLVVFQRYCHVYRQGELDELLRSIGGWDILESGYECGNHYIIARSIPVD